MQKLTCWRGRSAAAAALRVAKEKASLSLSRARLLERTNHAVDVGGFNKDVKTADGCRCHQTTRSLIKHDHCVGKAEIFQQPNAHNLDKR